MQLLFTGHKLLVDCHTHETKPKEATSAIGDASLVHLLGELGEVGDARLHCLQVQVVQQVRDVELNCLARVFALFLAPLLEIFHYFFCQTSSRWLYSFRHYL